MWLVFKWCNKCISIHSYDYEKILLLFPKQNPLVNQMENDSENECDISTILSEELPINDPTQSDCNIIHKSILEIENNLHETKKLLVTFGLETDYNVNISSIGDINNPEYNASIFGKYFKINHQLVM